jgi:hypothetical protein
MTRRRGRDGERGKVAIIAALAAMVVVMAVAAFTLVMVMVNGIGANLTNEEKRANVIDLRREHLID